MAAMDRQHPRDLLDVKGLYESGGMTPGMAAEIRSLASSRLFDRAKLLGSMLRVVYLYSAAMPGVIPRLKIVADGSGGFLFVVPPDLADLAGERTEGRLQQFAKLAGKPMRTVVAAS